MRRRITRKNAGKIVCLSMIMLLLLLIGASIYIGAGFFPVDNPSVLREGQLGWSGVVRAITENIRTDFMYNIIVFLTASIFGNTPAIHFMVQFAFFVATVVFAFVLLRISRVKYPFIALSLLVGIFSSPVAEQLYTIGKKEVFLTTSITACLLCLYNLVIAGTAGRKRWLLYGAYFASLFVSFTMKETSAVIVVPLLLLLLYAFFWKKESVKEVAVCLAVCVALILCQKAYQAVFIVDQSYTTYQLSLSIITYNLEKYVKYNFDILIWGCLGLAANFFAFVRGRFQSKYAFFLIVNLTGWAYIAGLCLWRWSMSYYLYPAAILFALSLGGLDSVVNLEGKVRQKLVTAVFAIAGTVSLLYGIVSNYCVASSQVDMSRAYTDSIYTLLGVVEDGDRVLLENYYLYVEQVEQTNRILTTYFQKDVEVYGAFQSIWDNYATDEELEVYGYTREEYEREKATIVPQVGDYVVHYINNRNYYGGTRAINPSVTKDAFGKLIESGYTLEPIGESIRYRWLWDITNSPFGVGQAEAGYQIWKITDYTPVSKFTGVYGDGWSGKTIQIDNYAASEEGQITVKDIGTVTNGYTNNTLRIYVDGEYTDTIQVAQGSTIALNDYVPADQEMHSLLMEIDKIFVPSALNEHSADDRELGINIVYSKGKGY